jgi:glucosamine--fructose-6-phosphate aminotransferase (isomerizing)
MTFSRYAVETAPAGSLVVAVSQSGTVRRVVEAVRAARARGLRTLVLTGHPESPLGIEPADVTMPFDFPKLGFVPGTSSYAVALIANVELAAAFASDSAAAGAVCAAVDRLPDLVAASSATAWPVAEEHACAFEASSPVLVLGAGPQLATAHFTARKMFEIPQLVTLSQETEEYAHDEFSIVDGGFRVLQYAPPDRGLVRNIEIAGRLRQLGVHLAVITEVASAAAFASSADVIYPLPAVPSDVTSITYALPAQILGYLLGKRLGGSYYHMGEPTHALIGDAQIYESAISSD